jgi:hypothetical protein
MTWRSGYAPHELLWTGLPVLHCWLLQCAGSLDSEAVRDLCLALVLLDAAQLGRLLRIHRVAHEVVLAGAAGRAEWS